MGWTTMYDIGMKERWFEGQSKTPLSSVFYADFEHLVKLIGDYNLMNF